MVFMQYDRQKCLTFMRYLHASHHFGESSSRRCLPPSPLLPRRSAHRGRRAPAGFAGYYDFGGKMKNPRVWQMLIDRNLLNREEVDVLLKKAANHSNIVSMWALNVIQKEIEEKRIQPSLYALFAADCVGVRSGVGKLKGLV